MRAKSVITVVVAVAVVLLMLAGGGCKASKSNGSAQSKAMADCAAEVKQLQSDLAQAKQSNQQLTEQINVLRGVSQDRWSHLVRVSKIEFGRFTRGDNDDDNVSDNGVIVYLQLLDKEGDKIKAAGEVTLELWDLAADKEKSAGRWGYGPEQLPEHWLGGPMANHYKFLLTWPADKSPQHGNLTLKCRFTDALSGEVFEIQKMIEVSVNH